MHPQRTARGRGYTNYYRVAIPLRRWYTDGIPRLYQYKKVMKHGDVLDYYGTGGAMVNRVRLGNLLIPCNETLHLACKAPKNEARSFVMLISRHARRSPRSAAPPVLLFAVICGVLFSLPSRAQVAGANLSGIVMDESGSAVPDATISIKSVSMGTVREVKSNSDGFYSAPDLLAGDYDMEASAKGFSTVVLKDVTLTVGSEKALDFTLKVGQINLRVEVTSTPTTVETSSSTLSAAVEQKTIVDLPLNGRDWTLLATLQPGIIAVRAQATTGASANRGNRGFGNQLSDSGHRPYENTYRIDGININDYSNGAPGSVLGVALGVDAIQEFSVVTTNYTAEYGRTSGAVINSVTKSGTNDFHGSAYLFDRDKIFDARNFFDPPEKPPFHRIQFGASAGAPLIKNKTFIFGDYEGIRESQSLSFSDIVPSQNARNGQLASGPVTVDAATSAALALWPLPNAGLIGNGDTGVFLTSGLKISNENYFTLRGDHRISTNDTLSVSYFFDTAPQLIPDALNNIINKVFARRQMVGISETHVFGPALVNYARLGFSRSQGQVSQPVRAINPAAADTNLGTVAGETSAFLIVNGITTAGGLGSFAGFTHTQNSFQANDDIFLTRGGHALKFGVAFERLQHNEKPRGRINGTFIFSNLADFLSNNPFFFAFDGSKRGAEAGVRENIIGTYVQDDWRIRPNLTLNLGLRYEIMTLPTEVHGPFGSTPTLYQGTPEPREHYWISNPTLRNFEPRVGFSWDPFKDGKTAVRGAFGMFDVLPLPFNWLGETTLGLPFSQVVDALRPGQGTFPKKVVDVVTFDPSQSQVTFAEPHPKRTYAMNWNLNIQHQFNDHVFAQVGYIGSHTVHQSFAAGDHNQVAPPQVTSVDGRLVWPAGGGTLANPSVGPIYAVFYDGSGKYNGLQTQLQLRSTHGFQGQASYTWSKCLDDGSSGGLGDAYTNSISSLIFFNKVGRRGPCDFDIRHNLSLNYLYDLPSLRDHPAMTWLTAGWQLGGIISASSGVPFTLGQAGDPLGQGSSDPFDFPNRIPGCNPYASDFKQNGMAYINANCFSFPTVSLNSNLAPLCNSVDGSGTIHPDTNGQRLCLNLFGNNGRNQLVAPRLVDVDFAILKNIRVARISETFAIQLRFEFFNIFNHANFQAPINNLQFNGISGFAAVDPGSAGIIDTTTTPARQIQLGIKILW
ncbi:MAG TPA: TonB-dependent receptor [Candidatus Acidoferrum sp.]|nr:TonB-dependent receptor [Candidatus Acidoferrum sp.]